MARKRKKKESEFATFIKITLAICFLLALFGVAIKPETFLGIFIGICVISLIATILSLPYFKGKFGEMKVARVLKKIARKEDGKVINDVIIIDEGHSSQIDHVLFLKSGIYVIETKNYSGRIYGKDSQKEWTQVLLYGKIKHKMYSPVNQNKVHVARLKKVISISKPVYSCVVLVKGNTDYIESSEVFTIESLKTYISSRSREVSYSFTEVDKYYNTLLTYKKNPKKTTKEHVKDIKIRQENLNNNICPRCNRPLVLRTSKDNSKFYGCSSFPKCRFTKKV